MQLWSCQITTIFQQSRINPTELQRCKFSLKTDCLQSCGVTALPPAPALTAESSDPRRPAVLCPAPICSLKGEPEPVDTLLKGTLRRTCFHGSTLQGVFARSPPSEMFEHARFRGIFHSEQGKRAWPLLKHTAHPRQTEVVKGFSPAPHYRWINSSLKWCSCYKSTSGVTEDTAG